MKKVLVSITLLTMVACDKQLDLAPEDTLVERDVFKSEVGAEQALSESYFSLFRAVTGSIAYVYGDFTTENLRHSAYYDTWDGGDVSPADESVKSVWQNYYAAINTANNVILNIPVYASFDAAKQQQFIAEAKFIRSYAYLDLLKLFGSGALTGNGGGPGLPLQLTPFKGYNTGDVIARSTNDDVYTQIFNDLRDAVQLLPNQFSPEIKTRSRATSGAAYALLSRACLYRQSFDDAADAAAEVIKKTDVYALTSNLLQLFPANASGSSQPFTSEYIFGFPISQMVSPSTSVNNNLGNGYFYKRSFWISPDFINQFTPADLRVSQLMFRGDSVYNADRFNDVTTFKFNNPNGRDNIPLIRLAEILLIRAEAVARTQGVTAEAVSLLNSVRSRSLPGSAPWKVADFSSKEALINKILDERRFELAFEGFYRYDLVRTGKPIRNPDVPENKKVLPIPQIEIDISRGLIQQNPGY
ncbi:MAG: RagB/SusD family nutrient uptake outer membrane protein [Flavisolibacter sp.]